MPPAAGSMYVSSGLRSNYLNHCQSLDIKPNSQLIDELVDATMEQTTIDISQNYLGRNGFRAFLDVLSSCPKLKNLVLQDNGLDNDAVVALCRVIVAHPALSILDLSGNPLSLAGGQAILDMVQKNNQIINLDISNTQIEERLVAKIMKQVQANEQIAWAKLGGVTPFQEVQLAHAKKKAQKKKKQKPENTPTDVALKIPTLLNKDHHFAIPKRSKDGWVVLNVYIACSRSDFLSELALIHNTIIPQLNERLKDRKVFLHPYAMYHDPEEGRQRYNIHDCKLPSSTEPQVHFQFIDRCRPLYIAMLGDKVGWTPVEIPEKKMFDHLRSGTQGPMNVLETLYGNFHEPTSSVGLYFFRQSAQACGTPEGIIEMLSSQYEYYHPDPDGTVVVSGPDAGKHMQDATSGDPQLQRKRWEVYSEMKAQIRKTIPPPLLFDQYKAKYQEVDKYGAVSMTGLEEFEKEFTERVWNVVTHFYPDEGLTAWYRKPSVMRGVDVHPTERRLFFSRLPMLIGRKRAVAHVESYLVSPPSRNMLLLVSKEGVGSSALLAEAARKTALRKNYITVTHFVKHNGLCDEANDLRSVLLSLCQQLLPESSSLPAFVLDTLDLKVIKDYWLNCLKNVRSNKTLAIFIDNMDLISKHPKVPPRINKEQDNFDPTEHDEAALMWPLYDWIPMALPKNVRLVATMYEDSRAPIDELVSRGVDGCAAYPFSGLEPKDSELYVQHKLGGSGVQLEESDMTLITYKKHHLLPQFLSITCEMLLDRQSKCNYLDNGTFLEMLPMTITGLCEQALERAEREVRPEIVRWFCSLMSCSREGLLELEVRELLLLEDQRGKNVRIGEVTSDDQKINLEQWGTLLGIFQPFLHRYLNGPNTQLGLKVNEQENPEACINGNNCILGIKCSTFASVIKGRYLREAKQHVDCHMVLARYYKAKAELEQHPLSSKGLRNYPYHMIMSQMWQPFMEVVVTLDHVEKAFRGQIGYQLYRDLHTALAKMHSYYINSGFDAKLAPAFEAWMERLREYIEFLSNSSGVLSFRPGLTCQEALATAERTSTYVEAKEYFEDVSPTQPHVQWLNRSRSRLHEAAVSTSVFSPNGMRILTASEDKGVKMSNLLADPIHRSTHFGEVIFAVYSVTSKYIVCATRDRTLTVYDASTGGRLGKCEGHMGMVTCADFSARGRYIASGSEDRSMRIWETETRDCLAEVSHNQYSTSGSPFRSVYQVAWHPSHEEIVLSSCDKTVLVWQLLPQTGTSDPKTSARCVRTCVAHTQFPVFFAKWSPLNSYILSAVRVAGTETNLDRLPSEDSIIKIWSYTTGRVVARLTGPASQMPVNNLAVAPCGSMIAMCSPKKTCALWKVDWFNTQEPEAGIPDDGEWEPKLIEPFIVFNTDGVPKFCAFSDNSTHFAAACENLIQVWSIPSRAPLLEFMTRSPITSFDWTHHPSAESGQMLAGDEAGRVYLLKGVNLDQTQYADQDSGI